MSLSPAYHLRTNKGVERLLFLDLLRRVDKCLPKPVESYRYVGLGGPYLEDFGMIHSAFGNKRMISLEIKPNVRSRQRINRPYSRIKTTLTSTETFIDTYKTGNEPLLVWLDYEWQDWDEQISESCALLQKLPSMSILKVTLTGRTDWLGRSGAVDPLAAQAEVLSEMFADYGPFEAGQLLKDSICTTLYGILRQAVAVAVPDTGTRTVKTLASYEYNDGTPVLTVTMMVGPADEVRKVVSNADLQNWPFAVLNWRSLKQIDVPSLGLRERLAVDRCRPDADARTVVKRLNLHLGATYAESMQALKNYIEVYRFVPQLLRVSL